MNPHVYESYKDIIKILRTSLIKSRILKKMNVYETNIYNDAEARVRAVQAEYNIDITQATNTEMAKVASRDMAQAASRDTAQAAIRDTAHAVQPFRSLATPNSSSRK
jgi:hypothetical protein